MSVMIGLGLQSYNLWSWNSGSASCNHYFYSADGDPPWSNLKCTPTLNKNKSLKLYIFK